VASDPPQDAIRAAGAVVWRPGSDGAQVVLVHRPRYDDWSFPKGKSERGEHVLLTATREVAEETGLRVVLGRCLKASEYEVDGRPKKVRYWAARFAESLGFVPGREVDDLAWLELREASARLSYGRDRVLLNEFAAAPLETVPVILLRHTHAGAKVRGLEADLARPLDQQGAADAELLARLLSSYGPCRVLTSAAERCIASVRPYAEVTRMPVEIEPAFTAAGDDQDDYWPAARRTAELVAERRPTLICAHRENLPVMFDATRLALGAGPDVQPEPPLGKGAFVVLQSAEGVLVSSERHDLAG
jgi:8-oxo-dGTP pyrophosphatase MutT (NUDIX family)/phosphohistidine phosphatase SixA